MAFWNDWFNKLMGGFPSLDPRDDTVYTSDGEQITQSRAEDLFPQTVNNDYNPSNWESIMETNREAQMAAAQQQQQFELQAADRVNAFNAQQAQLQRDWQTDANKLAMDFSAEQADLNRQWVDNQRATAFQTAVQDLKAAGLNPILAASGSGAAVTSGAIGSGISTQGAAASGSKASGSKADTDVTTYTKLISTLVSSAFGLAGDLGSAILGKLPNITKSSRKIGF